MSDLVIDRIDRLFENIFTLQYDRRPQHWEAVLGRALATGDLTANRPPADPGLARIHLVAADVARTLRL